MKVCCQEDIKRFFSICHLTIKGYNNGLEKNLTEIEEGVK